ncbi:MULTISPECIES: ATP-binding protein [Legionella]|uniref:histidine kinase n=1 Tax=Legionella resiliens TaxID=2905958 RepID=A0ABS8WZL8_9GAMM|nr:MULTISPECIES: ATP-binding protein [unclassified Legionella]MCE0721822.1 MEDS domain-containing protein [Legionella sp. 9fVS26]MCE3530976.1 MEDS domain-containing protein [Legionella sp. 8cVS16]QLZ70538.1 Adaptive-response sensory-kinase SasA [Legionella sp. PC1000]
MKTLIEPTHFNCPPIVLDEAQAFTSSGISVVKKINWGTHFCKFFNTYQDLMDILIPYFQTGLDHNELCIWINHEDKNPVYTLLLQHIPELEAKIEKGQMLFFEREVCFKNACAKTAAPLLADLLELEKKALNQGYNGLRIAGGPTNFSTHQAKNDFLNFENEVCSTFYNHKIIALCCYRTCECDSQVIFNVIKSHQFALILQDGQWEMVENASVKLLKDELHRQNIELEARVKERTKELEHALKSRDDFFSVASHELKTPITALALYLDGLLLKDKNYLLEHFDEFIHLIKKIKEQSICLETLIDKLLDVTSVLNEQNIPIERSYFNLSELVASITERYKENCRLAGCDIKTNIQPSIFGYWDPMRIEQVLANLITNAIKYAPRYPIIIVLKQEREEITLEVKDYGNGIAKAEQEKIFDPYVQLSSKKIPGGLGLGLWIVKQIVDAHQGTIFLESDTGKGCHFHIRLPICP